MVLCAQSSLARAPAHKITPWILDGGLTYIGRAGSHGFWKRREGCGRAGVDDDVADECAVEKGLDAEVEVGGWPGDGGAQVVAFDRGRAQIIADPSNAFPPS